MCVCARMRARVCVCACVRVCTNSSEGCFCVSGWMRVGRGVKEVVSERNEGWGRGRHCAEGGQTLVHMQ